MNRKHTDLEYEDELRKLRERLLLMGAKVEEMLNKSMQALVNKDSDLAYRMIEYDNEIDELELAIDNLCLRVLAKRQPVASDLRFITLALKIVTDLERMGDLGVNICERTIELNTEPPLKPYIDLPKMADVVQSMIKDALDAFVSHNSEHAQAVLERDHIVDAYYGQIFRELFTYMLEDPKTIHRSIKIQSIAKYLERIGDHATNLAEMVVFMEHGKDIRHQGRQKNANPKENKPHGVLFLCVHNAVRSQMAEAWAIKTFPMGVRIWSAGSQPAKEINPLTIKVMQEVGIDLQGVKPKSFSEIPIGDVDTVINLCKEENCPYIPGELSRQSWNLPDPTQATGNDDEVLQAFRKIRDEIKNKLVTFMKAWA
ncbi:MAG: phosphate signaling complex protein PhoU [Deltaproteobacteria bacterium]|nr:phosphate signaling complex protein PhoU [Deltaproteobacteria bacterium]